MGPRFPFVTQGFESFASDLLRVNWRNLVCVAYLQIVKSMVVCLCYIRG